MDLRKLKEKASESFAKGKFAKAAESYDEYCRADPKDLQARLRLGDAWAKVGKKDKAIEAYAWAAEGFAKDGFLPRAIAASKLILELDPAHKGVQKMLADLYARKTSKSSAAARPPPPAPKNGNGEAPAAAAAAAPSTRAYVSPPKKGAAIDPNAAPSPTNRADAIDLPEYEIPDEKVATQGSTFVPMAKKGPTPTRNLNAIEIEDDGGPQQRAELEKVELDVALTGMSAPPPPPAAAIPAPAPSAPPLELEVVAGAEEVEEVPIAGTPVYSLDDQLDDVPPPPKPVPPQAIAPELPVELARPLPSAPVAPIELARPLPLPPSAKVPVPQPSAPIYELEVVDPAAEELEEVVPLTEAIEQSVGPKAKPALEVLDARPALEVVDQHVEGELELVEVGGEPPVVPPEPPAPEPPPEVKLLSQPPGLKPKRAAEAEMSMRLEAISEPFGADEPKPATGEAAPAPAVEAVEPPPAPELTRGKPKTDPEAWAAPPSAPEASPSAPRIWIPGSEEQSFESLGDEIKPAAVESQTDLERGLEIFSSFEAADFLPTATRPAAPSEAARVPTPAAPADVPAEQSAATRRRMTFTELELEGDSLLHAVETAAAVGASERGELDTPPHEESMEEIEEGRPESGALPKIPLFSDLPEDAFIALFERCPLRRPTAGEVIIQQGSLGDAFYVICSGSVKVYRIDGERKREIATLEEGAFFGEMALLSGSPRTASVEASGDECQLLEISALILTELSSKYPPVASALKKFCRQRLLQNVMASASLFQPFSKGDRRDLVQKFRARDVNKGEVLIREGHSSDGMYVILSGEVEVRVGKTQVASLKEGDIFGEMSLLTKTAATASCVAAKRTSLLRLPKDDFDRLIMSHPQVLVLVSELTDARSKMNAALATPAVSPGSAPMV